MNIGPQHFEIELVVVSPHDDQAMPPGDRRGHLGHTDAVEQEIALLLEVFHGVGRERFQLHRQTLARVEHRLAHGLQVLAHAMRHRLVAEEDRVAVDANLVALADLLEDALTEVVEQRDARLDQHLRTQVGVTARDRRFGVEHRGHADRHQRVGGDTVEIDVVDDSDVARAQPTYQTLRPAVEPCDYGENARFNGPGPAQSG